MYLAECRNVVNCNLWCSDEWSTVWPSKFEVQIWSKSRLAWLKAISSLLGLIRTCWSPWTFPESESKLGQFNSRKSRRKSQILKNIVSSMVVLFKLKFLFVLENIFKSNVKRPSNGQFTHLITAEQRPASGHHKVFIKDMSCDLIQSLTWTPESSGLLALKS